MKRERIETEETRERRSILMRQRSLEFKDKYEKAIFPMRIEWRVGDRLYMDAEYTAVEWRSVDKTNWSTSG